MQQTQEHTAPANPLPTGMPRETIHDLRNLFGIVCSAKHLLEGQPAQVRRLALLQAIEAAAIRGGELTTSLLAMAGSQAATKRLDLNHQIMALEPMIRALTGGVQFDLCDDFLSVRLDSDAIDAVIFELLANAKASGATRVVVRTRRVGTRIWLTIADNGCGMTPLKLSKVRQCVDQHGIHGTGLCRVQNFARGAHAQLHFRSRAGRGTAVSLNLPTVLKLAACEPGAARLPIPPSTTMKEKSREKNRCTSTA
jgi:signal transduction histidine kinase